MIIPNTRDRVLVGVAAGGLAALLAACGGGGGGTGGAGSTATTPPAKAAASATPVTASLTDFHIQLSTQKFQPGQYTFTAENKGQHEHALELDGPGGHDRSKTLEPGQSTVFTVTLKSGSYQVFCPVDGHKDLGMKTSITVGGSAAPSRSDSTSSGHGY
ncbi:cupredoxin domain-containing protein [Streptomyces asoensis]|uniref:cupredoxin domain-containing protein n=1 Tax=Streptomyces asoensis TaxID=249586 RepID=UPI0033EAB6F4